MNGAQMAQMNAGFLTEDGRRRMGEIFLGTDEHG